MDSLINFFVFLDMNAVKYFESISDELVALKDRVRNFLSECPNWVADGEWKESVLRTLLRRNLPSSIRVGRGAVVSRNGNSRQIDLLIYSAESPVLFSDGDLVFVTPDAVSGIIEVKTRLDAKVQFEKALSQLADQVRASRDDGNRSKFVGLFCYDSRLSISSALQCIWSLAQGPDGIEVDLVCLGANHFIKLWKVKVDEACHASREWAAYSFDRRSAGYFIHNVIHALAPESVDANHDVWFPSEGKEFYRTHTVTSSGEVRSC